MLSAVCRRSHSLESAFPHLAWPLGGALAQATLLILLTPHTLHRQVDKKVLQLLEQRCKDKFFSHKQRGLARTDVAAHFKSLALTACSIAVKETILSRHKECTDAGSVHRLIEDNLDEARDAWKEQAKTQLQQFLNQQFSLLLWDVIGARPPTTIAPPSHINVSAYCSVQIC